MVGEPAPEPARIGRPAPERAVEWIAHHFDQVRRLLGIRGAETDPMQIKFWVVVLRKRGPVSVDLLEESACDIGAVARVRQQVQPTGEIRILQGNARDRTVVQVFDAVDRRRIDPTGAGRRHHDEHGSFEPANSLQFFQCKVGARFRRVCRS